MDALLAIGLLLASGAVVATTLAVTRFMRIDSALAKAATHAPESIGKRLAMIGWFMLAVVTVSILGIIPTAWLTTPMGASWLALGLFGSFSVIAWSRSIQDVKSASSFSIADFEQPAAETTNRSTSTRKAA